ncbi:MAG: HAMP domain-containing histidine kinase [Zoogloea sp.]|nr:HAMP domain-containing histidine kinase [Zoogloea sp.]
MAFLELDIRTLLRALVIGNLVAMAMVFAYKSPGNHVVPMRLFVASRLCQSLAFGLISLRGEIPLWVSAHLGNPLLFSGFALEMLAVARLCESRLRLGKPLALWILSGSLAFWSLGSTPTMLVVISSSVGAVIYAIGGVGLLAAGRRSRLQQLTALIYLGFFPVLALRSYLAQADNIAAMTSHIIQSTIYIIQFSLLLVGTVGFLLLMKERDDELLRESEQRERQRRTLQSNFIDMLTHELRAALAVVKISSSSLKRQLTDQPPELTRRVENIGRAADSMSAIVDRCIELERLDGGEQSIHLSECVLLDVVADLDVVCGPDSPRLAIQLNDTDAVLADRRLLGVALGNLIDNALKYAVPGTPVGIRCDAEPRGGQAGFRLTVDNQVEAGSAPGAEQVFVRYFRGANAHDVSGTGLGLYLTRELLRLQGGEADYRPDGDRRVSFSIWLPAPTPEAA